VDLAYYRQDMAQVPLESTIYEAIASLRPMWERRQIQGHLGRFGFQGDEVKRRAGSLSGGGRARVALAMLTLGSANLLILDEPTNHLDVESIEELEDALTAYGGTVLLVSHDRELLRALSTRLWIMHDTRITDFDGGFAEWEVVAHERAHAAAVRAAEAEALQRVHERQTFAQRPRPDREARAAYRRARKDVEDAEARIATLEVRIAAITSRLEEPGLYTRTGGPEEAASLGGELEQCRVELERAMEDWARAEGIVESLASSSD
jgi:ATP-binding cassette subfamily F protein 3